jgi:hypothetical protein
MQGQRGGRGRAALCAMGALFVFAIGAQGAAAAAPQISKVGVSAVTASSATLKAEIDPKGKNTTYRIEYGTEDCETSATCTIAGQGPIPGGSSPLVKEALLEGLSPAALYHFRVVATNNEGEAKSGDRVFATRSASFSGLPDGRAYEQASPVDKNGNDAMGAVPTVKATLSGGGITFASAFGIPGGKGAQALPSYLASRGSANWSTQGLLPPPSVGERAQVIGWSPDYTEVFSNVFRLKAQRESALVVQSTAGGEPVAITPYVPKAEFFYSGQSEDGSVALFESRSKLTLEALEEFPNLYAWDRKTKQITLAGIRNDETSPPKGAIAGSYAWTEGINSQSLRFGGALRGFYLRDERAIAPDGSIYFTEAGTGQLYRRINPTAQQSAFVINGKGEEECTESDKACTIHISASQKTDGKGPNGTDAAGAQPAAFQAASADGSEAFFTSPEKLTNDANTGPEQALAQIERDDLTGGPVEDKEFISPQRAIGVATDATHLYWVDPQLGTIGRADLSGDSKGPAFIDPGTSKCEVKGEPGVFEDVASTPRYVAVDSGHVYWTNTGCSDEIGALEGTGTIGRADVDGAPASVEAEFISGASNPLGIAVNATHIYWANAGRSAGVRAIARATIGGGEVNQSFIHVIGNGTSPVGVALNATHVYYSSNEEQDGGSAYLLRVPLAGGEQENLFVGKAGVRGVAVDAAHVYWASQAGGEEAIGRADLDLTNPNNEFIKLEGKPNGVAVDAAHLYWSTNGESPTNPGNDLYRYGPGKGELTDLTPDGADENGAEVQGVVAASANGKYVYFAANGVLDDAEEAEPGDCEGTLGSAGGQCSLYLWHEGAIGLLGRLNAEGGARSDALNWAATPRDQFGSGGSVPKTSFLSADGQSLLFRSQEQLTAFDNEGVAEFYRFKVGEGIVCATCSPAGEAAAGGGPQLGRITFPNIGPVAAVSAVSSRNFSASGNQFFFETAEALVPEDTNGQGGCPPVGAGGQNYGVCNDVYEWEAAGAGSCSEGSAAFSQINGGCIYLLSTGKSEFPSLFADASADGGDVFFFTREALVGQDKDELQDVYDARVGGGLAAQNPVAVVPCEGSDACHGPVPAPPAEPAAGSATFVGPGNPVPKHKKQNTKKHKAKAHKHKGKHKRTGAKGRQGR